ncbi:glycogen/starch/alpha-glucan phosphorylase [Chamaesiphon sp.]|uniref:glycogen/starch/alpha-glucan phosphorylase n=1 Tax=Chamaesiphon sp. TaxID=2814140 RepID=UPI003593DD84
MIENVNFRSGIGSGIGSMPVVLANLPCKSYLPSRNHRRIKYLPPPSMPRSIARNRQRWSSDNRLTTMPPGTSYCERPLVVNPCQWLATGNPRLASLVTETIGDRWMTQLEDLQQLATMATNPLFQLRWRAIKQANKRILANTLYAAQGIRINVNSLFDLQLAPIGGHQRQLLNLLHIITLVDRLKQNPHLDLSNRTFIFADLAEATAVDLDLSAASDRDLAIGDEIQYDRLKQQMEADSNLAILGLIQALATTVAASPLLSEKLQIVYLPAAAGLINQLYAAADLTEQIATAAIEDLDLNKLQAAVNGVISIGSLGKTNHWLQQTVGEHNCFRFGLAIPEIALFKEYGYDPYNYYKYYPQIRRAIDCLLAGYYTPSDPSLCRSIIDTLLGEDEHMVLADYIFYAACQAHVSDTYRQTGLWTQMSIMNVAGVK